MAVITVARAKRHLRLGDSLEQDREVVEVLAAAEAVVLDYVAQRRTDDASPYWATTVAAWDETTVPPAIAAAVLLQLGELWRFRGDDETMPAREHGYLSPMVLALLHRYRDPALA